MPISPEFTFETVARLYGNEESRQWHASATLKWNYMEKVGNDTGLGIGISTGTRHRPKSVTQPLALLGTAWAW